MAATEATEQKKRKPRKRPVQMYLELQAKRVTLAKKHAADLARIDEKLRRIETHFPRQLAALKALRDGKTSAQIRKDIEEKHAERRALESVAGTLSAADLKAIEASLIP